MYDIQSAGVAPVDCLCYNRCLFYKVLQHKLSVSHHFFIVL